MLQIQLSFAETSSLPVAGRLLSLPEFNSIPIENLLSTWLGETELNQDQFYLQLNGCQLLCGKCRLDGELGQLVCNQCPAMCRFPARADSTIWQIALKQKCLGGKGGFGANLKRSGGRMAKRSATNVESSRDLQGRRIRDLHTAKK